MYIHVFPNISMYIKVIYNCAFTNFSNLSLCHFIISSFIKVGLFTISINVCESRILM